VVQKSLKSAGRKVGAFLWRTLLARHQPGEARRAFDHGTRQWRISAVPRTAGHRKRQQQSVYNRL